MLWEKSFESSPRGGAVDLKFIWQLFSRIQNFFLGVCGESISRQKAIKEGDARDLFPLECCKIDVSLVSQLYYTHLGLFGGKYDFLLIINKDEINEFEVHGCKLLQHWRENFVQTRGGMKFVSSPHFGVFSFCLVLISLSRSRCGEKY
jgi:hypothetical protein